jgi:hypothetical protein
MKDDPQTQRVAAAHARCWNAIPWLVNGTLSADEATGVEQHLAECAECAAELAAHRGLQAQFRDSDPVSIAPQSAWQKMAERLDHEDEALVRGHFRSRPTVARAWPLAVAGQALVIVGLTTVMWLQASSPELVASRGDPKMQARYETLTSPSAATTAAAPRDSVRVVFRRDVTLTDVNLLLRELPAQIIAGPTEADVYTVGLISAGAGDNGNADQAARLLKRLRADARVVFAEPSETR